jgi:hypothetical protein
MPQCRHGIDTGGAVRWDPDGDERDDTEHDRHQDEYNRVPCSHAEEQVRDDLVAAVSATPRFRRAAPMR